MTGGIDPAGSGRTRPLWTAHAGGYAQGQSRRKEIAVIHPGSNLPTQSRVCRTAFCFPATVFNQRQPSNLAGAGKGSPLFQYRCASKVGGMRTSQQLSRQAIEEFKAIYQEEFGKSLTDEEVQEIALRLLRFFGILNQPISGEATDQSELPQ